jgi:hypothetical protein
MYLSARDLYQPLLVAGHQPKLIGPVTASAPQHSDEFSGTWGISVRTVTVPSQAASRDRT